MHFTLPEMLKDTTIVLLKLLRCQRLYLVDVLLQMHSLSHRIYFYLVEKFRFSWDSFLLLLSEVILSAQHPSFILSYVSLIS